MFQIRPIYDNLLPANQAAVRRVQDIFRANFAAVAEYADKIPDLLQEPFAFGYRSLLLVAEDGHGGVRGFSLFLHFPELRASFLDFLAVDRERRGGGVGGALYEATREYLRQLGSRGLYMEVLPDDPAVVADAATLKENRARLKFYEHYGVRPVAGTEYETPVGDDPAAPYLLFDGLGRKSPLRRSEARAAVRLLLRRKYSHLVDQAYIEQVVESFLDDPVRIRAPRYVAGSEESAVAVGTLRRQFAVVAGDNHQIHRVADRGYVERPARVGALRKAAEQSGLFVPVPVRHFGEAVLRTVHASDFLTYLKVVCKGIPDNRAVYPYVFPVRHPERRPKELAVRAGYYCIDTFTPLCESAYTAAREAVDTVLTAAEEIRQGRHRVAYAICRPPGHHAERRTFGGFCYFCNGAIAAQRLSADGRVAILDVDYHHGNGAQDIFYPRKDVLTVSLHGHPNFAYPYFSGFADETGEGEGKGFNLNLPLAEDTGEAAYLGTLETALDRIRRFDPLYLVLAVGFDVLQGDPTGTFSLRPPAMAAIGRRVAALGRPVLVVQEGGYSLRNLRQGALHLFRGLAEGLAGLPVKPLPQRGKTT